MSSSTVESLTSSATSTAVTVSDDTLTIALSDGRTLAVPLAWYPRLLHATPEERSRWRLVGQGRGLHWPDLDEDVSVDDLLAGKPSGESQSSLRSWLNRRRLGEPPVAVAQSRPPENLETVTISSLTENETVYVVPGTILADASGRLWIQGDHSFTRDPAGTSHIKITRSGESILVDRGTIGEHTYQRRTEPPTGRMLPVILVEAAG